jgi:indolepyruvate ferredoxin oxidoreductase alpha subunit
MVKSVFEETVFTGDIGCYTLGINMGAVDTCLCMGASIGMAGGLSRVSPSEGRMGVVATIGDSTFYHSGVPALINAVHTRAPFVLVIMDNNVTAMTGGQPTPAHDYLADGSQGTSVDLETVIRGCGVESTAVVDPYDRPRLEEALRQAKAFTLEQKRGVSVVITRRPCVRMPNVTLPSERFYITDKCDLCMTCLRDLECPAFEYTKSEKLMEINADLCAGCGFCVQVCPAGAIELKEA